MAEAADRYVQDLETKLKTARERVRKGRQVKALKEQAPIVFEIIDMEVSLALNKMAGDKPLSYDEYLAEHGAARALRNVRNLLDSAEKEEVVAAGEATQIAQQIEDIKKK